MDEKPSIEVAEAHTVDTESPKESETVNKNNLIAVPSLIGTLTPQNVFSGKWGMSDAAHKTPGQTSDFEYKLVKPFQSVPDGESNPCPCSGKYQGWFNLMMNGKIIRVEENNLMLKFTPEDDSLDCSVVGDGSNKFGKFNVKGTYKSADSGVHLYKQYEYNPVAAGNKRKSTSDRTSPAKSPKTDGVSRPPPLSISGGSWTPASAASTPSAITPRESGGRIKKPSIHLLDAQADVVEKKPPKSTPREKPQPTPREKTAASGTTPPGAATPRQSESAVAAKKAESSRAQRQSQVMVKCADLLKEIMKHPSAVWFLSPVDPIRLNIPDYNKIITKPMDFGTVKTKLEQGSISSIEDFGEHMRLVMRNAVTYNVLKDNPVHIAANTLSSRFEDRFGKIFSNYQSQQQMYQEPTAAIAAAAKNSSSAKKTAAASVGSKPRSAPGSAGNAKLANTASTSRLGLAPPAFAAPVADEVTHQILELQRQMKALQEEVFQLRAAVRKNEVSSELGERREAAQKPLSFEEKKQLINSIHKLPAHRMQQVIDIIQSAMPSDSGEDMVEIPIDELDTFTLRRLQKFVEQDFTDKRKRNSTDGGSGKRGRREDGQPRRGRPPSSATAAAASGQQARLATESFDALRGSVAGPLGAPLASEDGYAVGQGWDADLDLDMNETIPGTTPQHEDPTPAAPVVETVVAAASAPPGAPPATAVVAAASVTSADGSSTSDALFAGLWGSSAGSAGHQSGESSVSYSYSSTTTTHSSAVASAPVPHSANQDAGHHEFEVLDTDNL